MMSPENGKPERPAQRVIEDRSESYEPVAVTDDFDLKTQFFFVLAIVAFGGGSLMLLALGIFWAIPLSWVAGAALAGIPLFARWSSRKKPDTIPDGAARAQHDEREIDISRIPAFPKSLRRKHPDQQPPRQP